MLVEDLIFLMLRLKKKKKEINNKQESVMWKSKYLQNSHDLLLHYTNGGNGNLLCKMPTSIYSVLRG